MKKTWIANGVAEGCLIRGTGGTAEDGIVVSGDVVRSIDRSVK